MALTQISTAGVKDDAVTAGKIPANAVGSSELADNAVDTAAIANDAVTAAKLADNAVVRANISDDAVNADKITAGGVDTNALGSDSVTTVKILNANVTTDKLTDNAVTTSKITNDAVTNAKIGSGAVTQTKIGDGSIINAKVDNAAAIAGTKISPDFGSQNVLTTGDVKTGSKIITRYNSGGHFYLRNNSTGANFSSHLQTCSGGEDNNVQTHMHYYHGGYAELLHQGTSSLRTRSGGGVEFRNGSSTRIGIFDPEGIKFGTDTSSSNGLDDYEEGTWTPTYNPSGGASGVSYSAQVGDYVKIGRLVMVQFYINYSASSSSGATRVSGLPYNPQNYGAGSVMMNNQSTDSSRWYVLHVSGNSNNFVYFYGTSNAGGWDSLSADNGAALLGTITYLAPA